MCIHEKHGDVSEWQIWKSEGHLSCWQIRTNAADILSNKVNATCRHAAYPSTTKQTSPQRTPILTLGWPAGGGSSAQSSHFSQSWSYCIQRCTCFTASVVVHVKLLEWDVTNLMRCSKLLKTVNDITILLWYCTACPVLQYKVRY